MAWNNSVSRLANTSRRKVLGAALMYAISLTIRSPSAAGKETEGFDFFCSTDGFL
jgi:non-heme chloroperoxidase